MKSLFTKTVFCLALVLSPGSWTPPAMAQSQDWRYISSHLSQIELAARMKSSQSRVAKIEAGDPSVSLELLVRAVLSAGATKKEVAKALTATAR